MIRSDEYVAVRPVDLVSPRASSDSNIPVRPIEHIGTRDVRHAAGALAAATAVLELATRGRVAPALVGPDVHAFSVKFGLPTPTVPSLPDLDLHVFRSRFLREELDELDEAHARGDVVKYLDALVDLVYVAVGTAVLAGLPFDAAWHAVQRANMAKERASGADDPRSTRPHVLNVVKPAGWQPPDRDIVNALKSAGYGGPLAV